MLDVCEREEDAIDHLPVHDRLNPRAARFGDARDEEPDELGDGVHMGVSIKVYYSFLPDDGRF